MTPGFTGNAIDRADAMRLDPVRVAAAAADPRARLLALDGLDPVLDAESRLVWTDVLPGPDAPMLLGLEADGTPLFAPLVATPPVGERPSHLFRMLAELDGAEAALWGTARSLNEWHNRNLFCGRCGLRTAPFRAGWGRRCSCGSELFPRVDPVVIMLAEHDGRALIGRQPRFPAGRYSALAGFVEPGESIEEAVARELWEEAGVRATDVRYLASQPWPFPHSLMIGCVAAVDGDALTLDAQELEHAMWVTREEVGAALAGDPAAPFTAPPPYAIAHTLLATWSG